MELMYVKYRTSFCLRMKNMGVAVSPTGSEIVPASSETGSCKGHLKASKPTDGNGAFITCSSTQTLNTRRYHGSFLSVLLNGKNTDASILYPTVKRESKTPVCVDVRRASNWNMWNLMGVKQTANKTMTRQQKRSLCTMVKDNGPPAIHSQCNVLSVYTLTKHMTGTRAYSANNGASLPETPFCKSKTAYYDVLKVSRGATQAQIKAAYYKQSFVYHPDRNAGSEEATLRFSEISEAYTVLGNRVLKKKYDRGILSPSDVHGASRPSMNEASSSNTEAQRSTSSDSSMAHMRDKSMFDFDAFFKSHYGEQLQRQKDLRQRREQIQKMQEAKYEDFKLGKMTEISVGLLVVLGVAVLFSIK